MNIENKAEKKDNNYIATVMNRFHIDDDKYIYCFGHTVVGEYNYEEGLFVDYYGNEYRDMADLELRCNESPVFANVMNVADLKKECSDISLKEVMSEYDFLKRAMFFVVDYSRVMDDSKAFVLPIDINELIRDFRGSDINFELSKNDNNVEEENDDDLIFYATLLNKIQFISSNIIDGIYSLDELKRLRDIYEKVADSAESLSDSLAFNVRALIEQINPELTIDESINSPGLVDVDKLFKQITRVLVAQDSAVRRVCVELRKKELSSKKRARGILLLGPTGIGKTKLVELISKYLDVPFIIVDSTQLTSAGYTGSDIEEILWRLYVQCGENREKTERAIVCFDEVDKKGSSSNNDIAGRAVLNAFLSFIQGTSYNVCASKKDINCESVDIDTSNMVKICTGAFETVYANLNKKKIGFCNAGSPLFERRKVTVQDFVKYGMMPREFMGRVAVVEMNNLTVDDLKNILLHSSESELRIQEELFKKVGTKAKFTDAFVNAVAEEAFRQKIGARGLEDRFDSLTWMAFDECNRIPNYYSEVIFDESVLYDPYSYQLVKK